jgi:threonine synthase|uniref:Threonine synthase n=1 Tax=uncultured marine crenarchaeote HF4000_ANIW141N1 TaxID=455580 RepID=B3T630_9ARCH|nr:putative Pyridoxal-phosphate dependent enzyme [uncultured marine crenarchaeote HF4000_ANIW141N1]|tara:strand:+ start:491 stop:1705 length:1215 start_codon:yes stop_codon:yes gene_type:complete
MQKTHLQCRECKKEYDSTFKYICDECFGPLDVHYDFPSLTKDTFANREQTYWRYFELLPITDKSNIVSISAGMTPLVKAEKLGKAIGLNNLYIKNDSVNPTFSFKDRPAGVAVSKAKEFGLGSVGCASTGNLAAATAAHAAKAGLPCYIFAPSDIEHAKITQALSYGSHYIAVDGTYDDANRIAAQVGDSKGVGIVNINMRSYYVEGSKTLAYEVAEQLNWQVPDQLIVPTGSGAMLNAICKGFEELETVSLVNQVSQMHMNCAQANGCAPIVTAFKKNSTDVVPVESPDTVAKSLAIGDPGDGRYVLKRLKQFNGIAEESNNKEILDAILLLAKTEGIFTEPAGGVSVAVLKKMVEQGKIDKNEITVCYVTGNGLKATESLMEVLPKPEVMQPDVAKILAVVR